MAPATIELTILDANGIKNASFFGGKLNPYAVAFVDPGARRSTRVWHKGGADPIWHDRTEIVVEDQVLFDPSSSLTIQVFNQNFISTALVGETRVMLQDILRQKFRSHSHQGDTVTLQLRRPSGRGQGFIRVFLRLTFDGLHFPSSTDPKDIASSSSSSSNAWQGLPFPESDVPATGIPVMITQPYSQSFPLTHEPSSTCMNSFQLPCLPQSQHDSTHDYLHLASYVEGPYSPSCNDSPPQQWMNSFLLGVMTGAVAVALLCVIFTDVVWWRRGG